MTNEPEPNTRAGEALLDSAVEQMGEALFNLSSRLKLAGTFTAGSPGDRNAVSYEKVVLAWQKLTGEIERSKLPTWDHYAEEHVDTRSLPQPSNTCEMPEVAAMRYIEQLRSNYGTVTILPDNEEAETRDMQMEVDCCGEWTNWSDQRFYGETVIQCLARAVVILEKWKDMNNVG